ncbi:MAG: isoprenyl transferase [Parvularculaceae bacterium]
MELVTESPTPDVRHVAVIMDGNGRWAAGRGLPRVVGHRNGVEAVRRCVKAAIEIGLPYLTLYSFSTENWKRPQFEVRELMKLLKAFVDSDLRQLRDNNVKIRIIGRRDNLRPDLRRLIDECEAKTAQCTGLNLIVAFNYGGRDEILRAAQAIAAKAGGGELDPSEVTADIFESCLDTADIPHPDLVIRTSGERRLSNFLIWQTAYAEYVFLDVLWPDFSREHLIEALKEFASRDRRFGGVSEQQAAG